MCPERQKREDAILMKDPEALTPYYSTAERWTWGLPQQACANTEDLAAIPSVESQRPTRRPKPPPRQSHRQHHPKRQGTLLGSGFRRMPAQTGANSTPVVNPRRAYITTEAPANTTTPRAASTPQPVGMPPALAPLRMTEETPNRLSRQVPSDLDERAPIQQEATIIDPNPLSHLADQ